MAETPSTNETNAAGNETRAYPPENETPSQHAPESNKPELDLSEEPTNNNNAKNARKGGEESEGEGEEEGGPNEYVYDDFVVETAEEGENTLGGPKKRKKKAKSVKLGILALNNWAKMILI